MFKFAGTNGFFRKTDASWTPVEAPKSPFSSRSFGPNVGEAQNNLNIDLLLGE
jgi:hypothetical protein